MEEVEGSGGSSNNSSSLLVLLCREEDCEFGRLVPGTGLPVATAVASHLVPGLFFIILSVR